MSTSVLRDLLVMDTEGNIKLSCRPNDIFFGGTVLHKEKLQNQLEAQLNPASQLLKFSYCCPHGHVVYQRKEYRVTMA